MHTFKVTPWKVEGSVDYEKLVRDFGTSLVDEGIKKRLENFGRLHLFFRRGFVFSHRDLDLVLEEYEKGEGFFLYTGRGPSGKMHIAHLLPFFLTKWFQDVFKVNLYIQVTDDEKFLLSRKGMEDIQKFANDNIDDIVALGFDADRTFIFKNSEYMGRMYNTVIKIAKRINFSTVKAVFGFNNQTNIGMLFFPAVQAAPAFFEKKRCLIPCAIDQDPYWRVARDVAPKIGFKKPAAVHTKFMPGLGGVEGKMSSSKRESAIYLDDGPDVVREKVMKYAFSGGQPTVREHRERGGNPDIDVSYLWLYIMFEPDDKKIKKIREEYSSGRMLTGELKNYLIEKVNIFLERHRKLKESSKALRLKEKMMYDGKLAMKMWGR